MGSSCGAMGCHGSGAGGLTLPSDDPEKSFNVLRAYSPQQGYPYINDGAPGHTWILCNLHGDKGGRSLMPPTKGADATFEKVKLLGPVRREARLGERGDGEQHHGSRRRRWRGRGRRQAVSAGGIPGGRVIPGLDPE